MSTGISGLGPVGSFTQLPSASTGASSDGGSFSGVLKNALHQVNELSQSADTQIGSVLQGGNADMSSVMISIEKADVAFQLMMQVRNKIVSAYQDIEKMQF